MNLSLQYLCLDNICLHCYGVKDYNVIKLSKVQARNYYFFCAHTVVDASQGKFTWNKDIVEHVSYNKKELNLLSEITSTYLWVIQVLIMLYNYHKLMVWNEPFQSNKMWILLY